MIKILTVEREFGSGAGGIAATIAKQLNWKLWDHEITCEIARRLKCPVESVERREEKLDPTFYRLIKTFMRGSYEESFSGGSQMELLDADHLADLFERVINDAASQGNCVIVGRAAPWFLRERDDAMRIFIYAPVAEKIRRLKELGKSHAEAEELVARVDAERAAFVKKYYGKTWPQRDLYHLMINSIVGDENVIELIVHQMGILNRVAAHA